MQRPPQNHSVKACAVYDCHFGYCVNYLWERGVGREENVARIQVWHLSRFWVAQVALFRVP